MGFVGDPLADPPSTPVVKRTRIGGESSAAPLEKRRDPFSGGRVGSSSERGGVG